MRYLRLALFHKCYLDTSTIFAPSLGRHIIALAFFIPASRNPSAIELATRLAVFLSLRIEIMEGPAPLIVTAKAPSFNAFRFTKSYPGIKCLLDGSTIRS